MQDQKSKIFYVYAYQDENGVPIYVGKGKERGWKIHERLYDHLKIAKTRTKPHPFYFKLRKMLRNGFLPNIYKIQEKLTGEEANKLEKEMILRFGRKDLRTGTLLNLSDGGEGVLNMSKKHRNAISKRHKGVHKSPETIKRMSESKKGIPKSEEHKKKLSNYFKGRKQSKKAIRKFKELRWINNGKTTIRIPKDKINNYIGWVSGRLHVFTDAVKNKMRDLAKNRKPTTLETRKKLSKTKKNRTWINNGTINKLVKTYKLNEYLMSDWRLKRITIKTHNRNERRWINNNLINKSVNINKLETFLLSGWKKGKIRKNLLWINKRNKNKMINIVELENFLIKGWKKGKIQQKRLI